MSLDCELDDNSCGSLDGGCDRDCDFGWLVSCDVGLEVGPGDFHCGMRDDVRADGFEEGRPSGRSDGLVMDVL